MSYAGDVSPAAAWSALTDEPRSVLVDVRTQAEWSYVGVPDVGPAGKQLVLVEWQSYPDVESYNVLDGFEGPHDPQRHRAVSGWKVDGLPWVQG